MHNRRKFLKRASVIALASSAAPFKNTHAFFLPGVSLQANGLGPVPLGAIRAQGELLTRILRNYDRLEDDFYRPENDFNSGGASKGWPGDKEGRIILALTLQAQATGREPKYLSEIIRQIAIHTNEKGYLGPVMGDQVMEQQLSGHGWLLRGLCEYYGWKKDPLVKKHISDIIANLALPTRGTYRVYPIDPDSREKNTGAAAGTTGRTVGRWMLSSDIGCAFIFLDGVVQAYELFPSDSLKSLIREMIDRFLEVDLAAMHAQAHATLTALRGVLRFQRITGSVPLTEEVEKRYQLYRQRAMTENYENFNWFGRPQWTESCAIVDSLMVAVQLWQATGKSGYLEDAHHIYYNAICHAQRANGGFGLDNCPAPAGRDLKVYADEAYWCCTMRGAEGLASAVQYGYFPQSDSLTVPFFSSSTAEIRFNQGRVTIRQQAEYPFSGRVTFDILESDTDGRVGWKLFWASWMKNPRVTIGDHKAAVSREAGFLHLEVPLTKGTRVSVEFDQQISYENRVNTRYGESNLHSITYGPLVLGSESEEAINLNTSSVLERTGDRAWRLKGTDLLFSSVYHLMDPRVAKGSGYHKQILFPTT